MEKKTRKSAKKWEHAGELALIAIWGDMMEELRGCRKNSRVVREIIAEMQKQGFSYSMDELKTKMHNLSSRYRREKRKSKTSGSPSEWHLFTEMQNLLQSNHCQNMVQDSEYDSYFNDIFGDNGKTQSLLRKYSVNSSQEEEDPIATNCELTQDSPFSEGVQRLASASVPKSSPTLHFQDPKRLPNSLDYATRVIKQIVAEPQITRNEFTVFSQHVASQLQCLPIEEALLLQQDIQNLITTARLKCIHNKNIANSDIENPTI